MSADVEVGLLMLPHGEGLPHPAYESSGAAGMDLRAAIPAGEIAQIPPGGRMRLPTAVAISLPEAHEAQVRPRSGLALHHGVTCLNSPGTIDSDYRGEIQVILINHGAEPFLVRRGDRIAQLVVVPVARVRWKEEQSLDETARGAGGFGSSGVR